MTTEALEQVSTIDVEDRVQEAVEAYRSNHRHPANIAMHVAAYGLIARGLWRIARGRFGSGLVHVALGIAALLGGHRIEGSEPFAAARTLGHRAA